jgi:hypothetical protein
MTMWMPTHRVPDGGMGVWPTPDASLVPDQLPGGVAVVVEEVQGAWGRVRCDNGFVGWVDARLLVAAPPPPAPPVARTAAPANRQRTIAVVVVAAVAIVAAVALTRGDGDSDGGGGGGGGGQPARLVAMHVPDGWHASADGMVVAESAADLTADPPTGPVVRAEIAGDDAGGGSVESELEALVRPTVAADFQVVGTQEQSVSGHKAISVVTHEGGRVQILVAVHPRGRDAVQFVVDCPTDRYEQLRSLLASVPGIAA